MSDGCQLPTFHALVDNLRVIDTLLTLRGFCFYEHLKVFIETSGSHLPLDPVTFVFVNIVPFHQRHAPGMSAAHLGKHNHVPVWSCRVKTACSCSH